jgi:hypothetical protein
MFGWRLRLCLRFETRGQDSLKQPGSPFSGASSAPSSYTTLSLVLDSFFADWQAARPPPQRPCSGFSPRCPVGRVQNVLLGSTGRHRREGESEEARCRVMRHPDACPIVAMQGLVTYSAFSELRFEGGGQTRNDDEPPTKPSR